MIRSIKEKLHFLFFFLVYFYLVIPIGLFLKWLFAYHLRAHFKWSRMLSSYLRVRWYELRGSKELRSQGTIYFINHTSMADVFIDDVVTGGTANYLSRFLVGVVFPPILIVSSVWLFVRGKGPSQELFKWFDSKFEHALRPDLIIYPEAHRQYRRTEAKPLKSGMIQYAYLRKKCIQVVISHGKQNVLNEKEMSIRRDEVVSFLVGNTISPQDKTYQQFEEEVKEEFRTSFDRSLLLDRQMREGKEVGQWVDLYEREKFKPQAVK